MVVWGLKSSCKTIKVDNRETFTYCTLITIPCFAYIFKIYFYRRFPAVLHMFDDHVTSKPCDGVCFSLPSGPIANSNIAGGIPYVKQIHIVYSILWRLHMGHETTGKAHPPLYCSRWKQCVQDDILSFVKQSCENTTADDKMFRIIVEEVLNLPIDNEPHRISNQTLSVVCLSYVSFSYFLLRNY